MRSLMLSVIVLLAGLPANAQPTRATAVSPDAGRQVRRDFTLEQAALARNSTLAASMQQEARSKLDLAARAVLVELASGPENADPYPVARREVRSRFGRLSTQQSDLLSLYVLTSVAGLLSRPDELKRNGMNEMSEMTSLRLQMMMDRRSKLMSTLSNLMKKTSDTQKSLIQNLK